MAAITVIGPGADAEVRRHAVAPGWCGLLVAAAASAWLPVSAFAQQWEIEPTLEVVTTYSDNVILAPEGQEESDFVGQLNPGVTIRRDQGRLTTDIDYRLQSIFFASDEEQNAVYHQLDATATFEAVAELLYLDVNANIDQSVVDPSRPIPASNVVATANIGDVTVADVNPYLIQRLGSSETFVRMDYVWGIGRFDGFGDQTFSNVDDFEQERAAFYLGTDERVGGLEWSLTYNYQLVDYEIVRDYQYERAGVGITVPLGRGIGIVALGGMESDLIESTELGGLDSDFWEVGFRINAGDRNLFELRGGERFFGTSYFGNLQFGGRRFLASATYRENPTTSALDGLGAPIAPFQVNAGDPLFEDDPSQDEIRIQPIRAEVFVAKTLTSRFEFSTRKTLFYLTYSDERRDFAETEQPIEGIQDAQEAATLGFEYQIGARTTAGLAMSWTRFGFEDADADTDVTFGVLSVARQLGQSTDLRLAYRHAVQDSTAVSQFGVYTENAVDLAVAARF
jgi:hypothetical protein